MNSDIYSSILLRFLVPFMADKGGKILYLHQDNDPKHNSLKCRSILEEFNINWVSK